MKDRRVCVIGLGFVGLTLACALGRVGYTVYGVERRADVVESLRSGVPHFHEPGLASELRRCLDHGALRVFGAMSDVPQVDVYVITVGTPLTVEDRVVRLDMIDDAAGDVLGHMKEHPLIVLRSTVRLRVTRALAARVHESGATADVAFCPERTLEGKALEELATLPQVVGGTSTVAIERAAAFFGALTPTIVRMSSPEAAEMVKLVSNAHRDVLFGYVNELASLCQSQGLDAMEIVRAGNIGYPRTQLPRPGPAGGPCLTKDSHILIESCAPTQAPITAHARAINEGVPRLGVQHMAAACARRGVHARRVVLMGFAFKGRPETDDLRGSPAFAIRQAVADAFPSAEVRGWDPIVASNVIEKEFHLRAGTDSAEVCRDADVVVLMNEHPALGSLPLVALAKVMAKPSLVYDFWHQHRLWPGEPGRDVDYLAFGGTDPREGVAG